MEWCADAYDASQGADAVVIVTEWDAYRSQLDLKRLRRAMKGTTFIDMRNVFEAREVEGHGFAYHGVGLGRPIKPAEDVRTVVRPNRPAPRPVRRRPGEASLEIGSIADGLSKTPRVEAIGKRPRLASREEYEGRPCRSR